jgi:adenosine deaminase
MKVGLILSVDRVKHSQDQADHIVDLAITLKNERLPVLGVDLCGDPSKPIDIKIFQKAFNRAKENGLGLTIHFAEVPASSTTEELEQILSWQPDRLGHVIHVPQATRQEIVRRGIHVELCLTCNVLAGMLPGHKPSTDIGDHHFPSWYTTSEKPLLSLGTDDVGVFGSNSSEEHWLAASYFDLTMMDLISISRNAMLGAFADQETKQAVWTELDTFARGLDNR